MRRVLMLLASFFMAIPTAAALPRSAAAKAAFRHAHLCPATALSRGPCPGWVVDHVVPLCAGGPDRPDNMQWQTVAAAKLKDHDERRLCGRERYR